MIDALKFVQEQNPVNEIGNFNTGDNVSVHYKIVEGTKERTQIFQGTVIMKKGTGNQKTFTVRKTSNGVGVERIFPINSPFLEKVEINYHGKVRRARLFYLRALTGKKARVKKKNL